MKTTLSKSIVTGMFFLFLMFGIKSSASAQFMGIYFSGDSTNFCVNEQGVAYLSWSGLAGTYVNGDIMDVYIDWGDGNVDSYLNNLLTVSGSIAYMNTIYPTHTYGSSGTFYVLITVQDQYGFSQSIYDTVLVDDYCGYVEGRILLDDGDGVYELWTDLFAPGIPVLVTTSLGNYGGNTNQLGGYYISNIDQTATTYHVEVDPAWLTASGFTVVDPAVGYYDFTAPPLNYNPYNFLLNCGSAYSDFSISAYGWGFRPGMSTGITHIYGSSFTCSGNPANVNLTVTFDPMLTVYSSNIPGYTVTGNTLTASISNISNWAHYIIYYTVPAGTPAFTPLVFDLDAAVTNYTDIYPANNHYVINSEVRNSWDPNDKSTNVAANIDANVTEEIYYNVRFQNMGNADAIDISIVDTIDSQLDLSTFRLESQSHAGSYSLDPATRVVTFTFPNIMLPPQSINDALSQGYVRYKIKENPGLAIGSVLNNTAYIYFDTNPAIVTNTTANVNTSLGLGDQPDQAHFIIYPQPATENFYVSGINTNDVISVSIMDANGKAIIKTTQAKVNEGIYVGNLSAGMYFVTVETKASTFTQKLCIQH